jgi:adenylate cyclase
MEAPTAPRLTLRLLGGLEVRTADGREVTPPGRKLRALLACLALPPASAWSREQLIGVLWGDREEDQARGSLREALVKLRRYLGEPTPVRASRETIGLDPAVVGVDAIEFARLAKAGELERASELYRGELLEGVDLPNAGFEDWLLVERTRLHDLAVSTLTRLLASESGETVLVSAQRLLQLEPTNEAAHRALMQLYVAQGDRSQALRQYQICRDSLQRDLGVKPEAETERLYRAVREGQAIQTIPAKSEGNFNKIPPRTQDTKSGDESIAYTVLADGPIRPDSPQLDAADSVTTADTKASQTRSLRLSFILVAVLLVAAAIGTYYGAVLWRAKPVPSGDMPRIAILPLADMSAGEDKGYLSDAIAEGIITELARSKTYAVIARNSSFKYRDQPTDARQIGDELGVDYLLEGSQQKIGDRLKVTAQLLNTHDGSHLWANTYNREIGDLFVVQEDIIRTLADRVGHRIERPLPKSDATQVSALHYHLMGLAEIEKDFSAAGNELLRQFELKAIEADPNSQFGYIGLAWSYLFDAHFGWHKQAHNRDEGLKRAAEYADKAILLAKGDAEALNVRARIHSEVGEIEQALARFDQAIALNPSNSDILVQSTEPLLYVGRTDEAIDRIKQAMGIDPFYPDWFNWQMGWALYEKNDCKAALAAMQKMSRISAGAHRMLAGIYACLGNEREAKEALAVFLQDTPDESIGKERREWEKIYTAPGALERWIEHMRIAGLPE